MPWRLDLALKCQAHFPCMNKIFLCLFSLQVVSNPEKSIRRKFRKHQLKKEARKRKIVEHRPTAAAKRLKLMRTRHGDRAALDTNL